jgi:hypothetical protein
MRGRYQGIILRIYSLTAWQYFLRSTRYCLPKLFGALAKGSDADRMKGALYVLWNKGISKMFRLPADT